MPKVFNNNVCDTCKYYHYDVETEFGVIRNTCALTIFDCPNIFKSKCKICNECPYKSMCEADTLAEMVQNG